ncbi:uncharacterized protein LOC103282930 isoform X1 [Anolis carolinensis]|uniref:uncharacterized protein LOC103282930 isoform X1 n=1 Tax=Anolis carolinensis TaxID=28377 RepID=UPI002F2B4A34
MVSLEHKVFCVLQFTKTGSVTVVRRAFRGQFGTNPPTPKSIRRWYRQFEETGSLHKGKSTGRPRTSEENVRRIQQSFLESPLQSTRCASRELAISHTTVWRISRQQRSIAKPCRLQLAWPLRAGDKRKRVELSDVMLQNADGLERLVFSGEATFHLGGEVGHHKVRVWGLKNPPETVANESSSPQVTVFCAVSHKKIYGPFFFEGNAVTGQTYLRMLQNWLFPQLRDDCDDFVFQQDGAPWHRHPQVRRFLNATLPQRWIGHTGPQDSALFSWPPRSPDITPCDFFLWGYVKDCILVPPLATDLEGFKDRSTAAVLSVEEDTLRGVWDKLRCRLDAVRAAGGGHRGHS